MYTMGSMSVTQFVPMYRLVVMERYVTTLTLCVLACSLMDDMFHHS